MRKHIIAFLLSLLCSQAHAGTFTSDVLQAGKNGTDGEIKVYSEQGGTDYSASLKPPTTMTATYSLYLPVALPGSISFLKVADDGVMSFDIAVYQPLDADLTTYAGITPSANAQTLLGQTFAQMQASLSVDDLITLSGVAEGSAHLGTFTGSTINDSVTIKAALQALETAVENKQTADADLTDLADGSLTASKVAGVADADYGDVTVSGGMWAVEDDSHTHTTTTISGIDIGDDTNLAGTANEITLTGDTLSIASAFDISGKTSTKPVKTGTAAPGTCTVGELFYDTDATAGQNIYACTSTNTWTLEGDGGAGGGSMTTVKENNVQVGDADIVTLDFLGADFDLSESPDTEMNITIAAALTRDTEWDTESEVQTAWGGVNILLETEIDASSELAALMDDETGTGALVFGTSPRLTTSVLDTNGATLFTITPTSSAVNYFDIKNQASGFSPELSAAGAGTDLDIKLTPKGTGSVVVSGAGQVIVTPPANQTIAAGNTIAADGCGTLKPITSLGAVTTNTTNTFTAPASAYNGCIMHVVNVGANNITLDNNANFKSLGGADIVLGANDSVIVGCNGTYWFTLSDKGDN